MATLEYKGKSVTVPQCKNCGFDLRFKDIYGIFNFINGDKVTMCCRLCKTESEE